MSKDTIKIYMGLFYEYKDSYFDSILKVWKIEENDNFDMISCPENITNPARKEQYQAARYTLLECDSQFPLKDIMVSEAGKPFIPNSNIIFSLSHSGKYAAALIAKTTQHCGVDIELPGHKLSTIKNKFLGYQEYQQIRPILKSFFPTAPELVLFGLCWSAKETAYKTIGKRGLDFCKQVLLFPLKHQIEMDKAIVGCHVISDLTKEKTTVNIYLQWVKPLVITWALK